jgi:hypothetical protein
MNEDAELNAVADVLDATNAEPNGDTHSNEPARLHSKIRDRDETVSKQATEIKELRRDAGLLRGDLHNKTRAYDTKVDALQNPRPIMLDSITSSEN